MTKKNLILMAALAVAMMFSAAPKAHAGVIVGVNVGAPVYVHPVAVRPYVYVAPRPFIAVAPVPVYRPFYVAPRAMYYSRWYPRHEVVVRRGYGWRR